MLCNELVSIITKLGTLSETLQKHKAKWHKSCRNKSSDLKISHQEKRKHTSEVVEESPIKTTSTVTRQNCGESSRTMTAGCFFYGDVSDDLHDVSTVMIDKRVRECALELQDTVLLCWRPNITGGQVSCYMFDKNFTTTQVGRFQREIKKAKNMLFMELCLSN